MRSFISKVAHRLSKEVKPVAIYSSDLKRAAETAQTIARICNVPNVCPFYSPPLMLCVHFSWRVTSV
jgi:broad specificity phosphatase PhoE